MVSHFTVDTSDQREKPKLILKVLNKVRQTVKTIVRLTILLLISSFRNSYVSNKGVYIYLYIICNNYLFIYTYEV